MRYLSHSNRLPQAFFVLESAKRSAQAMKSPRRSRRMVADHRRLSSAYSEAIAEPWQAYGDSHSAQ